MASPFSIFRKHQKGLMAVLALFAMVAFAIPAAFFYDTGGGNRNPTVVKTAKFGDLTAADISNLTNIRQRLLSVLTQLSMEVQAAGGSSDRIRQFITTTGLQLTDREPVVNSWLLAREAESMGMVISNEAINQTIRQMTQDKVRTDGVAKILQDNRISQQQFFDAFREQLLAEQVWQMFLQSLGADTPGQRWDYFKRLNQKATVEVAPLVVSDFTGDVPAPDEATLRDFFDQYKDREPNPNSPEPGFREPARVAIQYFKANVDEFAEHAVTDEEVLKYYEENKERFYREEESKKEAEAGKQAGTEATPKEQTGTQAEPGKEAQPQTEQPSAEQPKDGGAGPGEKPAAEQPASTPAQPDDKTEPAEKTEAEGTKEPAEKTEPEQRPADDSTQPEEKSAEKPAEAGPAAPAANDQSAAGRSGLFHLASYAEPAEAADAAPDAASPASEAKPADDAAEKSAEAAPAEKTPAEETPASASGDAGAPAVPAAPEATAPAPEGMPAAGPALPEAPAPSAPEATAPGGGPVPEPPTRTQPAGLSPQVKEEIRRELAEQKIKEIFEKLEVEMTQYGNEMTRFTAGKRSTAPAKLDFAALARKYNLTAAETPLVSNWEVLSLDIGSSYAEGIGFIRYVFDRLPTDQPATSSDASGNRYLFWKTKQTRERVPKFTDSGVQQRVLDAWKLVQARRPALKKAEELADEARKPKTPLKDALAGQPNLRVTETEPFSWMSLDILPVMGYQLTARISEVKEVDRPGDEFMRAVFRLEAGQVGVAFNQPKTRVYVVRAVEFAPEHERLWDQFLRTPYDRYAPAAQAEQQRLIAAWLEQIQSSAGLEWAPLPESSSPPETDTGDAK